MREVGRVSVKESSELGGLVVARERNQGSEIFKSFYRMTQKVSNN